jgi:DNA-directed RNA polymerase omega subunit
MIMENVALENLLDKSSGSVYKLVVLASKRALEIAEGSPKLVDIDSSYKPSYIALQEISRGRVRVKNNS